MKKILLGSFIGAIIMFIWSFLAWTVLPINFHTFMYTPVQDSVLKILADNNVESGAYAMPMADNRNVSSTDPKFKEECKKVMNENTGKPLVGLYYVKEGYDMGASTLIRGLLFDFLATLAACIILIPGFASSNSFFGRWWLTLLVGLLLSASGPLINYNWIGMPWNFTQAMIINIFLEWGITGLWFAYYFKNKI